MNYISHSKNITINGQNWWVNSEPSGLYIKMLKQMLNQLFIMLEYHSKVHVIRIDFRLKKFTPNNKIVTKFNRYLSTWLRNQYGFKRVGYCWVREQEKSESQHYHYVLMLDGHLIQFPHKVTNKAGEIWDEMGGSHYKVKNCYYNVLRGNYESIQDVIYRISYLAKGRGKGKRPPQTKDYSTSRVKKKR